MKTLAINQTYNLKNGCTFVCDQEQTVSPIYKFGGKVFNSDGSFNRIAYYTIDGRYKHHEPSRFDIEMNSTTNFAKSELLKAFTAGQWFTPTNNGANHYLMCDELFETGEIEKRVEPIIIDGRIKGNKVSFKLQS